MRSSQKFILRSRIKSFGYAFNGLKTVAVQEHNFRVHLLAAVVAITAGFYFNIDKYEWIAVIIMVALVLCLEMVNASVEKLSDVVSPQKNKKIKAIKDITAAAVLVAAIASLFVAALIFIPKIVS